CSALHWKRNDLRITAGFNFITGKCSGRCRGEIWRFSFWRRPHVHLRVENLPGQYQLAGLILVLDAARNQRPAKSNREPWRKIHTLRRMSDQNRERLFLPDNGLEN